MKNNNVAAMILSIVGVLCLLYAAFRFFALDQSLVPLAPVGLVCVVLGLVLRRTSVPFHTSCESRATGTV